MSLKPAEMMHATCKNIHPVGTLRNGDMYTGLCGFEGRLVANPNLPQCPECEKIFGEYLTGKPCPLCNLAGLDHDKTRQN